MAARSAPAQTASPPTRAEFNALLMEVRALRKAVFLIDVAAQPEPEAAEPEPRQEETGYGHALAVQVRRRGLHEVSA